MKYFPFLNLFFKLDFIKIILFLTSLLNLIIIKANLEKLAFIITI